MNLNKAVNTPLMLIAAVAALGSWSPWTSATQGQLPIVLIDGERVTQQTDVGRAATARVQAAADDWESRFVGSQTELTQLTQTRQQQALTLNARAMAQMDVRIEELQVQLTRMQDDARRALQRLQEEALGTVNAALIPQLQNMAATEGYGLILDARLSQVGGLLYYSPELDVTDAFIARVNAATQPQ